MTAQTIARGRPTPALPSTTRNVKGNGKLTLIFLAESLTMSTVNKFQKNADSFP